MTKSLSLKAHLFLLILNTVSTCMHVCVCLLAQCVSQCLSPMTIPYALQGQTLRVFRPSLHNPQFTETSMALKKEFVE